MADLMFEPHTIRLHWQMPEDGERTAWGSILAEFLETLARRCDEHGQCLIGHIKGLATFPEGRYLRVNVVDSSHPADVAGGVPDGCSELSFTLNTLVYGLSRETLSQLVCDTAGLVAAGRGGAVTALAVGNHVGQAHNHDLRPAPHAGHGLHTKDWS